MTILIPAKNAQHTIRRALLSVANQTSHNWDVQVVVDMSTTDRTYEKIQDVKRELKCGKKIHANVSAHPGLPSVYKELIDRAEPKDGVCGFLDADDRLGNKAVERVMKFYKGDPRLGHLWTQFAHHPGGQRGFSNPLPEGKGLLKAFFGGWWGAQHFRTFRKSVYMSSRYELQLDIPYATDFNLAVVLAATDCHCRYLPEVHYYYHHTPTGITRSKKMAQKSNCNELRRRFRRWCKGNT